MMLPSAAAAVHKLLLPGCPFLTCLSLNLKVGLFYIHPILYKEAYMGEYGILVALGHQLICHCQVHVAAGDEKENFGLVTLCPTCHFRKMTLCSEMRP